MAQTTTTAAAAIGINDQIISVTSATGFAARDLIQCEQEFMVVGDAYVSGTLIPVRRMGVNAGITAAHPSGVNLTVGLPSDFASPAPAVVPAYPLAGRNRSIVSYAASGAIALPTAGTDQIAVLIGTSALAMTIINPTADMDGCILTIVSNGKNASTIDFPDATGLSGAGSSYDTITFQTGGFCALQLLALNSTWVLIGPPITGTTTALSIAIA